MVKISMIDLKKIIRNIKFRMILLIIVSFISSLYCMFDYTSIASFHDTGKMMGLYTYHIFDFVPGDGIISSLEYVLFYNAVPMVCFLLIIGIIFNSERKEVNNVK